MAIGESRFGAAGSGVGLGALNLVTANPADVEAVQVADALGSLKDDAPESITKAEAVLFQLNRTGSLASVPGEQAASLYRADVNRSQTDPQGDWAAAASATTADAVLAAASDNKGGRLLNLQA